MCIYKYIDNIYIFLIHKLMSLSKKKNSLFNFHFFRIYIYHPFLFFFNFLRYPKSSLNLLNKVLNDNIFSIYNLEIKCPKKIDNYFFANLNSKFNSFILEKYEDSEKKLIDKYLDKNDTVLELGGCIGVISNIINRKLVDKSSHLVLEIDNLKYNYLLENKELNKAGYKLINGVLSDKKNLYYEKSTNFLGGKLIEQKNDSPIKSYSLKYLERQFGLIFNTLIMDIEGGEVELIKEIRLNSFNKLIFEIHFDRSSNKYISIKKELTKNNFKLTDSDGKVEYWQR